MKRVITQSPFYHFPDDDDDEDVSAMRQQSFGKTHTNTNQRSRVRMTTFCTAATTFHQKQIIAIIIHNL